MPSVQWKSLCNVLSPAFASQFPKVVEDEFCARQEAKLFKCKVLLHPGKHVNIFSETADACWDDTQVACDHSPCRDCVGIRKVEDAVLVPLGFALPEPSNCKLASQTQDMTDNVLMSSAAKAVAVGLKHKEPPPAKDHTVEKQFTKMRDHQTLLLMDQMDQNDTIWYPTDTRLDTSPICHIRCAFAHTISNDFQQSPSIQCPVHDQHENRTLSEKPIRSGC